MTKTRGAIYAIILSVLGAALWFSRRARDKRVDQATAAPSLGVEDRAKIVLDSARHTVTQIVRQPGGSEKVTRAFLNTHGPVAIVEKKDGRTVLIQRTWGTEVGPFVGVALGPDIRAHAALGLNLFYVQRWEVGGGLLLSGDIHDTRAFAHVSYNAYGNVFIAGGIDNRKTAQLIAGLKF